MVPKLIIAVILCLMSIWTVSGVQLPLSSSTSSSCPDDVLYTEYPDPNNCQGFFICLYEKKVHALCPSHMLYNVVTMKCEKAEQVTCGRDDDGVQGEIPEETTTIRPETTAEVNEEMDVEVFSTFDEDFGYQPPEQKSNRQLIPTVAPSGSWTSVPEMSSSAQNVVNVFMILGALLLASIFQ